MTRTTLTITSSRKSRCVCLFVLFIDGQHLARGPLLNIKIAFQKKTAKSIPIRLYRCIALSLPVSGVWNAEDCRDVWYYHQSYHNSRWNLNFVKVEGQALISHGTPTCVLVLSMRGNPSPSPWSQLYTHAQASKRERVTQSVLQTEFTCNRPYFSLRYEMNMFS